MKLAEISDGELSIRIRDLRREQLRRAGGMRTCLDCMKPFTARRGARYCSGACRVRACRLRTKQRTKQTGEKLSVVTKTAAPTPLSIKVQGRSAAASPLRYPGGKSALAGFFADIIKQLRLRSTTYVEPYAGGAGAGIVLLQRGLVRKVVINDIDPAVYCFWKSVTEQPDRFASQVVDATLDVDEWRRQQAIYRQADETDPLALGFAFFYLNRTNRSGILNAGPIGGVNQNGTYKIDARYNPQRQRELEAQRKEPLSASALRELKDMIVLDLRRRTPPKTRTVDMEWLLDEQRLYFFSHSKGSNETFLNLFAQTFNMSLDLEGPGFWATQLVADQEQLQTRLKNTHPTVELLQGFIGLRPGPRELDEVEALASGSREATL